ncbi:hypothetical protein FJ365_02795 [Candidatus Dependentiae bacterium]|nr:hypothetical protein [Candidatus Dependentiae bacterium]
MHRVSGLVVLGLLVSIFGMHASVISRSGETDCSVSFARLIAVEEEAKKAFEFARAASVSPSEGRGVLLRPIPESEELNSSVITARETYEQARQATIAYMCRRFPEVRSAEQALAVAIDYAVDVKSHRTLYLAALETVKIKRAQFNEVLEQGKQMLLAREAAEAAPVQQSRRRMR